ncbi:MAG: DsrE/DsrF/DrsH-like family protein [Thermodesulfobacteriota bacterium]
MECIEGKPCCYTFICSRASIDGAYPSLILAINAQRLGRKSHIFFTFMGIDVIRKGVAEKLKFYPPGFLGAIPGMPELAAWMMKKKIDEAEVPSVPELLEMAVLEGVKLYACKMTMDMLKLDASDLIEGVEIYTAEQFLKLADACQINMFT